MATFDYTLLFTTDTGLTTGTATLTDATDWSAQSIDPADVEIAWGFKDPLGVDYRLLQVGQAGNIFPDIALSSTVSIPNPGGKVMTGDYTFTYMVVVNGAEGQEVTFVANLCTDLPELCLEDDLQCLTAKLSYRDKTLWEAKGFEVNSRSLVLKYENPAQQADVTSTSAIVTVGPNLFRGRYTVIATWNVTKGNYTTTVTAKKSKDVSCSAGSCKRWCQIKEMFAKWNASDNRTTKDEIWAKQIEPMMALAMMADRWEACGDSSNLDVVANLFDNLAADCNCGCGCDGESDVIVPVWPSGGGIQDLGISGSEFIIVGEGGEISINPTLITLINSLMNTVVLGDGTTTEVDGSGPSNNTMTYTVHALKPAPDSIKWRETWSPLTQDITLGDPEIVGTTFQMPSISYSSVNNSVSTYQDFIVNPAGIDPGNIGRYFEVRLSEIKNPDAAPGLSYIVDYAKCLTLQRGYSTATTFNVALAWNTDRLGNNIGDIVFGWPYLTPYFRDFYFDIEIVLVTPS